MDFERGQIDLIRSVLNKTKHIYEDPYLMTMVENILEINDLELLKYRVNCLNRLYYNTYLDEIMTELL